MRSEITEALRCLESVPIRLKASEEDDIVGVVVDADTDLNSRWQSLRDRLLKLGYANVPQDPVSGGAILAPPGEKLLPRMGIWIMPDNKARGILEDFLRFLVPKGSKLF